VPPTTTTERLAGSGPRRRNPLWWIVVGAFLVQLAAWAAWFTIASHHRVQEVPLATGATR
jgi:hypothetical protein